MQSQKGIEPCRGSMLFFSHCGTLGDFIVKVIGQKKVGDAETKHFWIIQATEQAICPTKIKVHPHHISSTLPFSPCFPFELSWIDLYMMLRNFVMIALHLFEAFVWARWSGFHLARQLALFPGTGLLRWGSVTELRALFVSGIGRHWIYIELLLWLRPHVWG